MYLVLMYIHEYKVTYYYVFGSDVFWPGWVNIHVLLLLQIRNVYVENVTTVN